MAGFQPVAATGLQAKNIGQKMGPQGLQHKPIQQPHQNPWNNNTINNNNNNNNNNMNNFRPPPPHYNNNTNNNNYNNRQQYQGKKYDHNFRNKSYNKKENIRHTNKNNQMNGTQYDSDESVFVTQAEIARRHSWGSSSLEPNIKQQPFGKPIHINNNNNHNNDKNMVSKLELSEKSFYKKYWIEDGTVGSGSFAKVRKVTRKKDKKEFALKMIKKAGKTKEDLEALQREISILAKLCHPNVVKLLDWCETKKRIYMVVQFCSGGDVFERILKQKTFSEKEAAHVVRKVSEGLEHVHSNNIIHRDLKPDNLMYLTKEPDSNIMLIDFGLAGDTTNGELSTPCGTAHYVAPEVLSSKPYNSKADMWSLGVIIYMLLCGFPPFFDAQGNQKRLYKLIKLGKYRFPSPYWDYVSEQAKDLIKNLLQLDPQKRYSATQVLKHKWIHKSSDSEDIDLGKMYMEQMEHFSSSRHFIDDGLKLHQKIPGADKIGGIQNNQYQKKQIQPIQYFKHKQHAPKPYKYDDW